MADDPVPGWIRDVECDDPRKAVPAIRALGKAQDRRAVPGLIMAARSPRSSEVRMRAVEAIGAIGDAHAASAVADALADPDAHVRERACHALARLGAADRLGAAARLVRDADRRVRMGAIAAVSALARPGHLTPAIVADLWSAALDDPDEPVRTLAAEALARQGATGADQVLRAALARGGPSADRARHSAHVLEVARGRRA